MRRCQIYTVYFAIVYKHKIIALGIVELMSMSLGKFFNEPNHSAVFGLVAKLIKTGKISNGLS